MTRLLVVASFVLVACKASDDYPVGPTSPDSGPRVDTATVDMPPADSPPPPDAQAACITRATLTTTNLDVEVPSCTTPTVCTVIVLDPSPTPPTVVGTPQHISQGSAVLALPMGSGAGLYVVAMVPDGETCQHKVDVN
jgi:hypothetical protein